MFTNETMLVNHLSHNFYPPLHLSSEELAKVMTAVEDVASYGPGDGCYREESGLIVDMLRLEWFVEKYEQTSQLCYHCEADLNFWTATPEELERGHCRRCIDNMEGF